MNNIHKKKNMNKKMIKIGKNKKRADRNSAPRAKKKTSKNLKRTENGPIDLDTEIIIGLPNIDKKMYKSKISNKKNLGNVKNNKKKNAKKLTEEQIKRRKFIFKIIKWTTLSAIIIGIIIFVILSPIFNIKSIEVINNNKISSEQIVSLSKVKIDDNTFKYSKSEIIKNIKQNAYIENVKINRALPDVLKITIEERTPKLMLLFGNAYVYINNQGYILEISSQDIKLPIIKGYKTSEEDIIEGKRLCNEDLEHLSVIMKILEYAESEQILDKITAINVEEKNDYKLIMDTEQKTIHLGDCSMLETRMLWIKSTLEKTKDVPGDIFINMDLNTERPFFREKV